MRSKVLVWGLSLLALLVLVSSCSSGKPKRTPVKLAEQVIIGAKFKINWTVSLQSNSTYHLLQPYIDDEEILTMSTDGTFNKIDHDGNILGQGWLEPTSSNVSKTSMGFAYVNKDGFLKHRQNDRTLLWSSELKALAFHAPVEINQQLVVQTIDGRLNSFDLQTGQLQWVYQIGQSELTIKGQTTPLVYKNNIITAFSNGRVVSVNAQTGNVNWERSLKGAASSNELKSLSDIDAPMQIIGNQLFVIGNQGNMAVLNLDQGTPIWEKDVQSLKSFALDSSSNRIYIVLTDGSLTALNMATGTYAWHEKFLLYRNPTGIVLVNGVLLVGDYEGYLHAISTQTGLPLNRYLVDRKGIQTQIVEYNDNVYIQGQSGKLISLNVSEI